MVAFLKDLIFLTTIVSLTYRTVQSSGLTSEEISKFTVSGNFGATVRVDSSQDDRFVVYASGLPDHNWERINPATPSDQNYQIPVPKNPQQNSVPGCVPLGMIGLARTGVALYNPLDGMLENAVEGPGAEVMDSCDGHPSPNGAYHYHKLPQSCLYKHEADEFIGVALDGYPIYGPIVSAGLIMHGNLSQGGNVTSAHLDKCHGTTVNGQYRYYITHEFPYILGCFRGNILHQANRVTYNCFNDTSVWNTEWNYYLCHCVENTGMNQECAPDNPNRPSTCPDIPDCSPDNINRPNICERLCAGTNNRPRPPTCDATTTKTTTSRPNIFNTGEPTDVAGHFFPEYICISLAILYQYVLFS